MLGDGAELFVIKKGANRTLKLNRERFLEQSLIGSGTGFVEEHYL
jgi:hypothetical protein